MVDGLRRTPYLMVMQAITQDHDVVVIGAGAAGLAATRELVRRRVSVVLLEARHRLGGRAHTEWVAPDMPVDLGAGWLHSADGNPFVKVADEFGVALDRSP